MKRYSQVAAYILAGGVSSRMGREKGLLEIAGEPLIIRTARVIEPLVSEVTVVGPVERYSALGLRAIADQPLREREAMEVVRTPLVGIATALNATKMPWNLILACDLPYLTAPWLDWLPARFSEPSMTGYQQYLLHADSQERFSVVSFVWGPGQKSPIHDHTVWGIVGVLRGAELEQRYSRTDNGCFVEDGAPGRLEEGEVTAVSPVIGDFHRVANALEDRPSTSIHVYGANIGAIRRSMYELDGTSKTFVSGYSNSELPNLWDHSKDKPGA